MSWVRRGRASVALVAFFLVGVLLVGGCSSPADLKFSALPVGAPLPSSEECAKRVGQGHAEEVPENERANHTTPDRVSMPIWEDFTEQTNKRFVSRIDGKFTGTTGEILEWAACKWGLDVDVLRAAAYQESDWKQSLAGDESDDAADCLDGDAAPCPTSFGIVQLKATSLPGSAPFSRTSTAFNLDYYGARMRGCYEGWVTYLGGDYAPGDLWGCVGWHWSGYWKDAGSVSYIGRVQRHLHIRSWERIGEQQPVTSATGN